MKLPKGEKQRAAIARVISAYTSHANARIINATSDATREAASALHVATFDAHRAGVTAVFLAEMVGISSNRMGQLIRKGYWLRVRAVNKKRADGSIARRAAAFRRDWLESRRHLVGHMAELADGWRPEWERQS